MSTEYMTIERALSFLQDMGFNVSLSQLRTWASNRSLPFFKVGKRLYISESGLTMHLEKLQSEAVRGTLRNDHLKGALAAQR